MSITGDRQADGTIRATVVRITDSPGEGEHFDGEGTIRSVTGTCPALTMTVEGHTCNIGTAEYNLALGDRRANSVRDYLVSRGISADRLQTVSYGEERPKYDNSREETRRLNRRAAMVVRLQ